MWFIMHGWYGRVRLQGTRVISIGYSLSLGVPLLQKQQYFNMLRLRINKTHGTLSTNNSLIAEATIAHVPACCRRKQGRVPSFLITCAKLLVASSFCCLLFSASRFSLLASRFTIHTLTAIHDMHLKNPINNCLHHITISSRRLPSSSIKNRTPLIPAGEVCPRSTTVSTFFRAKHQSIIETTLTHPLQTYQHSLLLLSLSSTSPRRLYRRHQSQESKAAATNSFPSIGVYIIGS